MTLLGKQPLAESLGSNRSAINGLSKIIKLFLLLFVILCLFLAYRWWVLVSTNRDLYNENEKLRANIKRSNEFLKKMQQMNGDLKDCRDAMFREKSKSQMFAKNSEQESEKYQQLKTDLNKCSDDCAERTKILEGRLAVCQNQPKDAMKQPSAGNGVQTPHSTQTPANIFASKTNQPKQERPPFLGGKPFGLPDDGKTDKSGKTWADKQKNMDPNMGRPNITPSPDGVQGNIPPRKFTFTERPNVDKNLVKTDDVDKNAAKNVDAGKPGNPAGGNFDQQKFPNKLKVAADKNVNDNKSVKKDAKGDNEDDDYDYSDLSDKETKLAVGITTKKSAAAGNVGGGNAGVTGGAVNDGGKSGGGKDSRPGSKITPGLPMKGDQDVKKTTPSGKTATGKIDDAKKDEYDDGDYGYMRVVWMYVARVYQYQICYILNSLVCMGVLYKTGIEKALNNSLFMSFGRCNLFPPCAVHYRHLDQRTII
ncbi:hypothetical protein HELRODRAFT_193813 [Helobdella robusta]|uniref:Uncharacterized protein n=1 Tax=Helobdella robusta TaxID=6412 RepID=T1FVD9_HELRO|nr:hypothetical protein HELRODRAFT_193813 [Helobdella robusta]ESN94041.1 hypothetical protein HELRODRAFT_193813 [Helobdella robusta]